MTDEAAVAWLREQVQARLAAAKAAPGIEWRAFGEDDVAGASVYDEQWVLLYPERYDHDNPLSNKPGATGPQYIQRSRDEMAAHIALNDPQDVIARCEAELGILRLYEMWSGELSLGAAICALGDAVRHVASAYRHRPGYAEHWEAA